MQRILFSGFLLLATLTLMSCGGGESSTTNSSPPADDDPVPSSPAKPEWARYFGAHYTLTPKDLPYRDWAMGGLRDPGGNRANYQIADDGNGGYVDNGISPFTDSSIPIIDELLTDGRYAVITVGGVTTGTASVFFDSMDSIAGRDAYQNSLYNRIDAIQGLASAGGWEQKIYFQFGNEIQNINGYYGAVCNWVTTNVNNTCDLATEFVPAYVERYLAPGVESLEAKSQELFGRPDAIRMVLGSIVNLTRREDFLNTLLNYQVQGSYAPSLSGKHVYELIDTVSIHYTIGDSNWRTPLDNFRQTYVPSGNPVGRVHRLFATEEIGANAAEQGFGMAAMLHGIARYLSWWQENNMGPDDGHMFAWGADINGPPGETCNGCTSVDQDIHLLTSFTGDNDMTALTTNQSTLTASSNIEMHEFAVANVDKRVIILFSSDLATASVSDLTLDLADWNGQSVSISAYRFATQGPEAISVTPATETVTVAPLTINIPVTLDGHDALLIFIDGST